MFVVSKRTLRAKYTEVIGVDVWEASWCLAKGPSEVVKCIITDDRDFRTDLNGDLVEWVAQGRWTMAFRQESVCD